MSKYNFLSKVLENKQIVIFSYKLNNCMTQIWNYLEYININDPNFIF